MNKIYHFKSKVYLWPVILGILAVGVILISIFFTSKSKETDPSPAKDILHNTGLEIQKAKKFNETSPGVYFAPILVFHHIATAPANMDKAGKSLFVEPKLLAKILIDLQKNKYKTVFVSEIAAYLAQGQKPPKNMIALTFDDGYSDFYNNAWPLLQKYKIKSSLYIITKMSGGDYLNKDQIIGLDKSGLIEIGSHTVSHPYLTKLSKEEQYSQLKDSKDMLEKLLGKTVSVICYPYGSYNKQVKDLAMAIGYKYGLTYNHLPLADTKDIFSIDRVGVWPGMDVIGFLQSLGQIIK